MPYAPPTSLENRFRVRRFELFKRIVDQVLAGKETCRILDLGGTPNYWEEFGADLDWERVNVCALNVTLSETTHSGITAMVGDARDVSGFQDLSFDIVHSNSVIEHVGRWTTWLQWQGKFGDLHPDIRADAILLVPDRASRAIPTSPLDAGVLALSDLLKRTCGFWRQRPDVGEATKAIQSALLLDKRQMQFLFLMRELSQKDTYDLQSRSSLFDAEVTVRSK